MAIKFNYAIDLLDDSMPELGYSCEGFAHEDIGCLKKSVQNPFEASAPFVGIIQAEKAVEVLADCVKAFLLLFECFCLTALVF